MLLSSLTKFVFPPINLFWPSKFVSLNGETTDSWGWKRLLPIDIDDDDVPSDIPLYENYLEKFYQANKNSVASAADAVMKVCCSPSYCCHANLLELDCVFEWNCKTGVWHELWA